MALSDTEEAQIRQLLEEQAAILSLANNEAVITSKLAANKVTLSDLTTASSLSSPDIFFLRQGTIDKSITASLVLAYILDQIEGLFVELDGDTMSGPLIINNQLTVEQIEAESLTTTNDILVNQLTVGRGSGNILNNVAVGRNALGASNTGSANTAIGVNTLLVNTTGTQNTALGQSALEANTTGSRNTALGVNALVVSNGSDNTALGRQSGQALTSGNSNTFVGMGSGSFVTSGSNHTILGGFNGNQNGLNITTATNGHAVISDGLGNLLNVMNENGSVIGSPTLDLIGSGYKTQKLNGVNGSGYRMYANEVEVGILYADVSACISGSVGNRPYEIWTNGVRAVRVTADQKVLVGTTTNTGERMQVNGTVKATTFSGSGANLTGTAASLTSGFVSSSVYLSPVLNASTVETFAHGLGRLPIIDYTALSVSTANNGYSVGDEIHNWADSQITAADCPVSVVVDTTNIYILNGTSAAFAILNKTTATPVNSARSNFKMVVNYR